jgi:hypothetical protein
LFILTGDLHLIRKITFFISILITGPHIPLKRIIFSPINPNVMKNVLRTVIILLLFSKLANSQISSVSYNYSRIADPSFNLIKNGSFEQCTRPDCSELWFIPLSSKFKTGETLNHWKGTGGGSETYASLADKDFGEEHPLPPFGKLMAYFGNNNIELNELPTFNMTTGEVTFTTTPFIHHKHAGYGFDNEGPALEQQVSVTPGHTYMIDFWVSGEFIKSVAPPTDGDDRNGFMQFSIIDGASTYSKFLAIPGYFSNGYTTSDSAFMRYHITFIAHSNSVIVKFQNYGHISMAGYSSTELLLDDVIMNDLTVLGINVPVLRAKPDGNTAVLSWNTSSDNDVARYEVQKSWDGEFFVTIASKFPTGNVSNSYQHIDQVKNDEVLYYRLKIVDRTGTIRYSRLAQYNGKQRSESSPRVTNTITNGPVAIQNLPNSLVTISVRNMMGICLLQEHYPGWQGGTATMQLERLPAGTYVLQVATKDYHWTYRIIKI